VATPTIRQITSTGRRLIRYAPAWAARARSASSSACVRAVLAACSAEVAGRRGPVLLGLPPRLDGVGAGRLGVGADGGGVLSGGRRVSLGLPAELLSPGRPFLRSRPVVAGAFAPLP
jgi:hypothetical protein